MPSLGKAEEHFLEKNWKTRPLGKKREEEKISLKQSAAGRARPQREHVLTATVG